MSGLQLTCLPAVAAVRDGRPVEALRGANERALLVYLAVEGDRAHPRGCLAGLLWPEAPEATARRNLNQALLTLRAALGEAAAPSPALLVTRDTLAWNPAAPASVDVGTIVAHLDAAEAHGHAGPAGVASCPLARGACGRRRRRPGPVPGGVRRAVQRAVRGVGGAQAGGAPAPGGGGPGELAAAYLERGVPPASPGTPGGSWSWTAGGGGPPAPDAGPLRPGRPRRRPGPVPACRRLLAAELGAEPAPETAALAERCAPAQRAPPGRGRRRGAPGARPAPARPAAARGPGGALRPPGGDGAPARSPVGPAPRAGAPGPGAPGPGAQPAGAPDGAGGAGAGAGGGRRAPDRDAPAHPHRPRRGGQDPPGPGLAGRCAGWAPGGREVARDCGPGSALYPDGVWLVDGRPGRPGPGAPGGGAASGCRRRPGGP